MNAIARLPRQTKSDVTVRHARQCADQGESVLVFADLPSTAQALRDRLSELVCAEPAAARVTVVARSEVGQVDLTVPTCVIYHDPPPRD